jgi:hypothetical protein
MCSPLSQEVERYREIHQFLGTGIVLLALGSGWQVERPTIESSKSPLSKMDH